MKLGINTYLRDAMFGPADFHRLPAIKAGGVDGIEVAVLYALDDLDELDVWSEAFQAV